MFDKNEMIEDEYGFNIYREAKELPMTLDRMDRLVSFVSNYVNTRNRAIKKKEESGVCDVRKEIIETKIMQTIGAYTIVKSVEQAYWDDGTRAGRSHNWYDVCLDGGNGDIVASYDKLNEARRWARSDVEYKKQMCKNVDLQNIPENGFKSIHEVNAFYRKIDGETLDKIYKEYYGKV